jgi:hypothetical protein
VEVAEASERLPRHAVLSTDSQQAEGTDRRLIGATFTFVIASLLVSAFVASIYCRGLYQDGFYYLLHVAEREGFYLVDPARTTVEILRQAPIVLLSKLGGISLFARGQVFSFAMLALPTALVVACWFIAPRDRKPWTFFPALHLLVGFSTMSFNAVGEAPIASSYFWILLFLLLFRTRGTFSQACFLLLCLPAFQLQESLFLLMPLLLLACALRWRTARGWQERGFLLLAAIFIVAIFRYEIGWIIHPRIPVQREVVLRGLYTLGFLYFEGRVNLAVVTALGALAALAGVLAAQRRTRVDGARSAVVAFAVFVFATIVAAWLLDRGFSPQAQALSRYNPVYASIVLGLIAILTVDRPLPARLCASAAAIIVALAVAQAGIDFAGTARWRAYVADFQDRLAHSEGRIAWTSTTTTGDPVRDINWQVMTAHWVLPIMSIVFARDGTVRAIVDYPEWQTFRPIDPSDPEKLPKLPGIDYGPYRRAMVHDAPAQQRQPN